MDFVRNYLDLSIDFWDFSISFLFEISAKVYEIVAPSATLKYDNLFLIHRAYSGILAAMMAHTFCIDFICFMTITILNTKMSCETLQ